MSNSNSSADMAQSGLLGAVNLRRENTEIRDHLHLMDAEGSCDLQPSELDIQRHLAEYGWVADEIDIFYDNMQQIWRWSCKIAPNGSRLGEVAEPNVELENKT